MHLSPQRILIIKLSSLGDIVHALPAVSALRQQFPLAHFTWLVKTAWASILEGNPDIDEVISSDFYWNRWPHLIQTLRKQHFDLIVDFQGLLRSGLLGRLTGARMRVGFAQAREGASWFYTHRVTLTNDLRENNLNISHPIFGPSLNAPQSKKPSTSLCDASDFPQSFRPNLTQILFEFVEVIFMQVLTAVFRFNRSRKSVEKNTSGFKSQ